MEPIREAEMQTQPGKRLDGGTERKRVGKGPLADRRHRRWRLLLCWPTRALCAYAGSLRYLLSHTATINGMDVGGLTVAAGPVRGWRLSFPISAITLVR